jgi:hypothetical protein
MSRFRVTMSFDLSLDDEEAAKAFARQFMHGLVEQTKAEGGGVVTDGRSPDVAIHETAESLRATATVVAYQALARGVQSLPFAVAASEVRLENEPL